MALCRWSLNREIDNMHIHIWNIILGKTMLKFTSTGYANFKSIVNYRRYINMHRLSGNETSLQQPAFWSVIMPDRGSIINEDIITINQQLFKRRLQKKLGRKETKLRSVCPLAVLDGCTFAEQRGD